MHGLPETPVVFHDLQHQLVLDHVRKKLAAILESAQALPFTNKSAGNAVAIFEASSPLGTEAIAFRLGHDGSRGETPGGITVQHRLNGRITFKVMDITREGGNQCPPPPATLKGRNRLADYLPMLAGWVHLASHAMAPNGDGAISEEVRQRAFDQRREQKALQDHIRRYLAAALATSQHERLGASLWWPTGQDTGWFRLVCSTLSTRAGLDASDEIMRHFKPRMGGSWNMQFENSGTGLVRFRPVQDNDWQISPLDIIETMKAMRDPAYAGLSFKLGD